MLMMMSSTLMTSSSSFDDNVFKKKKASSSSSFRLNNTLKKTTTAKTMRNNNNKVQQKNNVTIKAEAISEDSSSFSKNSSSDIFADLVENSSFGSSHNNNGFVERGEHIISSSFNQNSPVISNTKNALKVFSGSAHPELSTEIANYLGMDLGKLTIKKFADGEIYVQINESIRGSDVFLVQPTCPPTNDNIMELLVMIDACRRASCRSITAVIPYFGK